MTMAECIIQKDNNTNRIYQAKARQPGIKLKDMKKCITYLLGMLSVESDIFHTFCIPSYWIYIFYSKNFKEGEGCRGDPRYHHEQLEQTRISESHDHSDVVRNPSGTSLRASLEDFTRNSSCRPCSASFTSCSCREGDSKVTRGSPKQKCLKGSSKVKQVRNSRHISKFGRKNNISSYCKPNLQSHWTKNQK